MPVATRRTRAGQFAVALAIGATVFGALVSYAGPARADDIGARQKLVTEALQLATADADEASKSTVAAAAQLDAVQARLDTASRSLQAAQSQLAGAQAVADSATLAADAAREDQAGAQQRLDAAGANAAAGQGSIDALARLRFESGPSEHASALIGAPNPEAYVQRAGLLQMVARGQDTRLLHLRDTRSTLAADRAVVRDRTATLETRQQASVTAVDTVQQLVDQAATAQQDLRTLAAQRAIVLASAERSLAGDSARVDVLSAESASITKLIQQREAAARAAAAAALAKRQAALRAAAQRAAAQRAATQRATVLSAARRLAAAQQAPAPPAPQAPPPLPPPPAPAPVAPPVSSSGLLRPVDGPITSGFGYRLDPYTGQWALHAGIDFGVDTGTPIHAALAGTVIFAGQETGYGNYTCIDHGGGFSTCYAHQSLLEVSVGQQVARGQVIGLSGSTGYSTGPHLHFETRVNGEPVDPMRYL